MTTRTHLRILIAHSWTVYANYTRDAAGNKQVFPSYTKAAFIALRRNARLAWHEGYPPWRYQIKSLRQKLIRQFWDGQRAPLGIANSAYTSTRFFFCLDLDIKDRSQQRGLDRTRREISRYFQVKWQTSTSGLGLHGWGWIEADKALTAEEKNEVLNQIKQVIKSIGDKHGIGAEVKGHAPYNWQYDAKGYLTDFTFPQWIRVPDQETLEKMPTSTLSAIQAGIRSAAAQNQLEAIEYDHPSARKKMYLPSCCPKEAIDRVSQLVDCVLEIPKKTICQQEIATALWVMRAVSALNADGTLPTALAAGLWNKWAQDGAVGTLFDGSTWAAIRNYLSDQGLLDWENNRYIPTDNGSGVAMKWKLRGEIVEVIKNLMKETETFVESRVLLSSLSSANSQIIRPVLCHWGNYWQVRPANWQAYAEIVGIAA